MERPVELSKPAGREENEHVPMSEVVPLYGTEENDMVVVSLVCDHA
jgi:hypothetical protein